jgi:hypothetical protein
MTMTTATLSPALQAILDAPLPAVVKPRLRREGRKVWAAEVRKLFKSLGLRGISVTAPNYSMASSIHVLLPEATGHEADGGAGHDFPTCPACRQRAAAMKHVKRLILAAFPDLDDRNEYPGTDYDFCLTVN